MLEKTMLDIEYISKYASQYFTVTIKEDYREKYKDIPTMELIDLATGGDRAFGIDRVDRVNSYTVKFVRYTD